ncbi:putative quinol monooxygenase [Bacillus coahuilensis]|uniref:putative quinol monooxygenase n=1 Tax=Bacillus coahuilensis TaxID=408580 RepID=UPI00192BD475
MSYELFQDVKDPTIFTMIEEWESTFHLTNHMNSPHFKQVVPTLGELTSKEGEINVYTPFK